MFTLKNSPKIFRHQTENFRVLRSLTSQAGEKVKTEQFSNSEHDIDWHNARPYSEIPRPGKFNFIRSFLPGGRFQNTSALETAAILKEELGEIYMMPGVFGKPDNLMVTNPDHIALVYRTEGNTPIRASFETIEYYRTVLKKDFFGETTGLIFSQGENWEWQRKTINPIVVHPQNVKLYTGSLEHVVDEFVQRIREVRDTKTNEVPADFEDDVKRFSFEGITSVALNQTYGLIRRQKENPEALLMFKQVRDFLIYVFDLETKPSMWKVISTPTYKKMMKCQDNIFNLTSKFISDAMIDLENRKSKGDVSAYQEPSVLEKLLKIDKKFAIVMTMDMLLAGVDAASSVLIGLLLLLAKNPENQAILREEVLKVMPTKDTPLTVESMKNMPYLRACIKESMRCFPVASANFRRTACDLVLGGYQVPKGTNAILNSSLMLLDENYFTRANEFVPERWLRKTVSPFAAANNINPFAYLPFGFGMRNCIGKRIVDIEMELCITKLVRNFHIDFKYPVENIFKQYFFNVLTVPFKMEFTDIPE